MWRSVIVAVAMLSACLAAAETAEPAAAPSAQDGWIVTLGAGASFGPRFLGASGNGFSAVPTELGIRRKGTPEELGAPDDGLDYTLFDAGRFEFGVVADIRDGRSRSEARRFVGIHGYPATIDAGVFAEYWPIEDRLRMRIEVRQALRVRQGLVADLSMDWFQPLGNMTFSIGPRVSLGDARYMRTAFGISELDALANGSVAPFHPGGGITSVGLTAALRIPLTPSLTATVYDSFKRLTGEASRSPLTSVLGSRNQNTIGLNLSYSFGL